MLLIAALLLLIGIVFGWIEIWKWRIRRRVAGVGRRIDQARRSGLRTRSETITAARYHANAGVALKRGCYCAAKANAKLANDKLDELGRQEAAWQDVPTRRELPVLGTGGSNRPADTKGNPCDTCATRHDCRPGEDGPPCKS